VPSKSVKKMNLGLVLRAGVGDWIAVIIFESRCYGLKSGMNIVIAGLDRNDCEVVASLRVRWPKLL
jgi:hypothetical protein